SAAASVIAAWGRSQNSARKFGLCPCTLRQGPRGAATGDQPATLGAAGGPCAAAGHQGRLPRTGGRMVRERGTAVAVTDSDSRRRFEVICEVEPPTRPDLTRVRQQIGG